MSVDYSSYRKAERMASSLCMHQTSGAEPLDSGCRWSPKHRWNVGFTATQADIFVTAPVPSSPEMSSHNNEMQLSQGNCSSFFSFWLSSVGVCGSVALTEMNISVNKSKVSIVGNVCSALWKYPSIWWEVPGCQFINANATAKWNPFPKGWECLFVISIFIFYDGKVMKW